MCSISGILNLNRDPIKNLSNKLNVLNKIQSHRGPDARDIWSNKYIGLAHTRLSIIDLSKEANQPMQSDSGNLIVYNGEIYNYKELKKKLEKFFYFKTNSDTEVILAAYEIYGKKCVEYLDGMFAFALWDKKKQILFSARDRYGIKPFYYSIIDNNLIFSSEAKALIPFQKNIDVSQDKLFEYLTFQYNTGHQTLFVNINQLSPGETLTVNQTVKIKKYWDFCFSLNNSEKKNIFNKDMLIRKLNNAVKKNLISDVNLCSHLSGGVDSSLITVLAKKSNNYEAAFHGYFSGANIDNEIDYAKYLSKYEKIKLKTIKINDRCVIDSLEKVIYSLDYPVAGPGSIPQYILSNEISKDLKVVLGGQGADELFAGYMRYLLFYSEYLLKVEMGIEKNNCPDDFSFKDVIQNLHHLKNYQPLISDHFKSDFFASPYKRYFSLLNRSKNINEIFDFSENVQKDNYSKFLLNISSIKTKSLYEKVIIYDLQYFLPSLLHVEDRVSMAHGLETRVPFLDNSLVDYLMTISTKTRFKNCTPKALIQKIASKILPDKIIKRTDKMGFPVPLKKIIKNNKDYFYDLINKSISKRRPFLNKNFFKKKELLDLPLREIWGLISLELWYQQYFDSFTKIKKSYYL